MRNNSCEILLNLDQWFRRRLTDFLSRALAALLFSGGDPICFLEEGIMGNIHAKFFVIWTSGSVVV